MADRNSKKQTPRGGRARSKSASNTFTVSETKPVTLVYANDSGLGLAGDDAPLAGRADFRPKRFKGGSAETFVNGRGVDTSRAEGRNFVSEAVNHERDMFGRLARAEKEDFDIARREEKERQRRERAERGRQEHADRRFRKAEFSSQEGWDNLGRSEGVDEKGNSVKYGRGAEGVKNYDERYGKLKARADFLDKLIVEGDFTGRGKEWKAIRKMVERSHESGGLTEKQLEGLEKKMDALLGERNDLAEQTNRKIAFYERKDLQDRREKLGDKYGMLSDDQVRSMSESKRWDNIRKASEDYSASISRRGEDGNAVNPDDVTMGFKPSGDFGVVGRGGDRVQAMQALLDNGISLTAMARMAVQSGDKKWADSYAKIMGMESGEDQSRAIENLGHEYLSEMLGKGEAGVEALTKGLEAQTTVSGKPRKQGPNRIVTWDDMSGDGVTKPAQAVPANAPAPLEARRGAEDEEMYRQGASTAEVVQPGPTEKRAEPAVQAAGGIAESAARTGVMPALDPRTRGVMQTIPGEHQSNGSVGELTPIRAAGLPDMMANVMEAIPQNPLEPRKKEDASR